ncbi:hypothetical protein [Candidatus Nitrotoga sp. BS]|uniref:hypothetical protein n=1 Tax=Candidatus Nitrotoga sp. BS TaxID=2890408 RepID=UPI00403DEE24
MRLIGRVIVIPSVVVHDLNVGRANISPHEADAPLNIDSNAVLTLSIIFQRFQVIARRRLQKRQCLRRVQLGELTFRNLCQGPEAARALSLVERLGVLALERLDHAMSVLRVA